MAKHEFEGIVKRVEWKGEECLAVYAERKPGKAQMWWPVSRDHPIYDPLIGKKVKVIIEEVVINST